jgi:hypothetical protein
LPVSTWTSWIASTFWMPTMAPEERVRMAVAPSMVMLFSSGRLPLMLKPPLPRSPKPRLLKLPPLTPAFRPATPIGLRPENDSCSMSLDSTVLRSVTSDCRSVCSAVTVTDSLMAPVERAKSMVTAPVASSWTASRTAFLNPWSSALIVYRPGGRLGNV